MATLPDTYTEKTQKQWQPWRKIVINSITYASSITYTRIKFVHEIILTLFGMAQLTIIMKIKEKFESLICVS